jgi:hypothetical protein
MLLFKTYQEHSFSSLQSADSADCWQQKASSGTMRRIPASAGS